MEGLRFSTSCWPTPPSPGFEVWGGVPRKWEAASPFTDGLRFKPFRPIILPGKTPLDPAYPAIQPFSPSDLLEALGRRGLQLRVVVNLCLTLRHYDVEEFKELGISVLHYPMDEPGKVPQEERTSQLLAILFDQLKRLGSSEVIFLHGTSGVDRPGFVCASLAQAMGFPREVAMSLFMRARGESCFDGAGLLSVLSSGGASSEFDRPPLEEEPRVSIVPVCRMVVPAAQRWRQTGGYGGVSSPRRNGQMNSYLGSGRMPGENAPAFPAPPPPVRGGPEQGPPPPFQAPGLPSHHWEMTGQQEFFPPPTTPGSKDSPSEADSGEQELPGNEHCVELTEELREQIPRSKSGQLLSIGTVGHASGFCKPCVFFPKGSCRNAEGCRFCHDATHRDFQRAKRRKRAAAVAAATAAPPSRPPAGNTALAPPAPQPSGPGPRSMVSL